MRRKYILLSLVMVIVWGTAYSQVGTEISDTTQESPIIKVDTLPGVVVSGVAGSQRLQDASSPFLVLSAKKLKYSVGSNFIEAISNQPGLAQISTGTGISKPVIRGLGYNRVVVVEQGIRQEGQQWGNEHGLEVDALGVSSVEILKGPASLMYGSDAIAGVMVLFPYAGSDEGTVRVRFGGEYQSNNGLYNYHIGTSGNLKGWIWAMHYSDKAAHSYKNALDGYVPGSWFAERNIRGMVGVRKRWGYSFLRYSRYDFTPGIPEGERALETGELVWEDGGSPLKYGLQEPYQRVIHSKVVSDNGWYVGGGTLILVVGYQQNYRREFEEIGEEAELSMRLHTVNYEAKYQREFKHQWELNVGIGGMWQRNSNFGEELLVPDYGLLDFGLFAMAGKRIGKWNLSGGIRVDNRYVASDSFEEEGEIIFEKMNKNFTGVTGSLGVVWNITNRLNLRINVARGYRAPNISELSANGVHEGTLQYLMGNSALRPEYSTQADLGMDFSSKVVTLQFSGFCNVISNYIFLQRLPYETDGYHTYQYRQGNALLAGGELVLNISPVRGLDIDNAFGYVRGIQLRQPSDTRDLPLMPAPRWTSSIRYEFPDFAKGYLRHAFVGIAMEYNLPQNHFFKQDDTETRTPDYALFNLSLGIDIRIFNDNCIELIFSCMNLFDKVYQSHLSALKYAEVNCLTGRQGVSAIGRSFCVKLNVPIDFVP